MFHIGNEVLSKVNFLDKKKEEKYLCSLEGVTLKNRPLKTSPFKKLKGVVNMSSSDGSAGPRARAWINNTTDLQIKKNMEEMYAYVEHKDSNVTAEVLEEIYVEQEGLCYWSGLHMNPYTIDTAHFCLSMSPDRLDNYGYTYWGDYTKKNIVITTQLTNRGRQNINPEDFAQQCLLMGWKPLWFSDPRREEYLDKYSDMIKKFGAPNEFKKYIKSLKS